VRTADQTTLHVKYEWEISRGKLRLADARETDLFPSSSILHVSIVGQNGKIITATQPLPDEAFLSERMRRLMQNAAATDALYIGQPTSAQRSGSDGLLFAGRLLDRDGSQGGMVLVSVAPRYFTAGYNEALFMKNGFMGIVGRDDVRLTRTGETVHAPQSPALVAAPRFARLTGNAFLGGDEWFSDKRSRYTGWHAVQAYPLIALAGLEQKEVLAPYRAKRAASIHDAVLATLTLAAFALIAMVLSLRLASSRILKWSIAIVAAPNWFACGARNWSGSVFRASTRSPRSPSG
jgi:hypothetical protein